jgi:hypothetical protein
MSSSTRPPSNESNWLAFGGSLINERNEPLLDLVWRQRRFLDPSLLSTKETDLPPRVVELPAHACDGFLLCLAMLRPIGGTTASGQPEPP